MAALNEKQSKELCRKIEQYILKNGYFILDMDDWDNLHIEYKPYAYGKNLEYADYTKITVTLDGYNVTDVLRVKYYFARNTLFSKYLGDNYVVYYTDKDTEHLDGGGEGSNLDEAAEFIANRFIELVEDKIMNKKLEARIARLEKMLNHKSVKNEAQDLISHKFYETANKIQDLCVELAEFVTKNDCANLTEAFMALDNVEENFPQRWANKYRTFLKRKSGEEEEW